MAPGHGPSPAIEKPSLTRPTPRRRTPAWVHGLYAGGCLYLFLSAINIMGSGLKVVGESGDWLERLFAQGDNPLIALMGAVLVTAVVQSSSFTTALIITLVAAGDLKLGTAVYAIMGANIGTSVTGMLVSLGSIRIKRQFRRAFTAALMHDIFNLVTVAILFPLEWISGAWHDKGYGLLTRSAMWASDMLGMQQLENPDSPVKIITRPLVRLFDWLGGLVAPTPLLAGIVVAVCGLLILFIALVLMVKNLKGALLNRVEGLFRTYFFRNDLTSYVVGVISTILVQASTITTSLIVPLAGAGIIKLKRVFAFMLGANLGTTVTGVIAATANPIRDAVTVAIFHVSFNLIGTAIWYPGRAVPIGLAKWYGNLAATSKRYAFLFLLMVFVIIPLIGIVLTEWLIVKK
jgi:solute carrier family 34 (sodium-dependent phosphate cotransporter)